MMSDKLLWDEEKIPMDKFHLTGHKLLWHEKRLLSWCREERIAPLHIELGLTNVCNAKCIFCYGQYIGKENFSNRIDLPKKTIVGLFTNAKNVGVKSITLIGEGENTISPYFYDALKCARDINLDLGIATNGIALDKKRIRDLLESFVWIRFSIGASNPMLYKYIHGVDTFDILINNIKRCVEIKKQYGLKTTLGLQMVVIGPNIQEIVPLAKLGAKLGVDYFEIKPCCDTQDNQLEKQFGRGFIVRPYEYVATEAIFNDIFSEAESFSNASYSVIVKRDKFKSPGTTEFKTCLGTQFIIAIDSKGNVAPCGHLLGYRRDEFSMGNVNNQLFLEIIQSERYWKVQKKVQKLNVVKECETNCMHVAMNIWLEKIKKMPVLTRISYLQPRLRDLETVPEHINFV